MTKELKKKVDRAIRLLQSIPTDKGDIELSYSGGKDSDVILELAKMAGIKVRVIYKNTTIDPSGTIKHCKEVGAEIVNPRITFLQLIRKKGYPSRFARFCCSKLKEYKIYDIAIQGIRKSESKKRKEIYREPEICRVYGKRKKNPVQVFLPILDWTGEDVEEFIKERNIKCHPIYYRGGNSMSSNVLGVLAVRLLRAENVSRSSSNILRWCGCGSRTHKYIMTQRRTTERNVNTTMLLMLSWRHSSIGHIGIFTSVPTRCSERPIGGNI